ncbi:hypothetical protein B0H11DRAFT_2246302 [Mycena galericulata]|nr:hypothetical protein B0H11DRAFT_2246302 [Mycena galericulata]
MLFTPLFVFGSRDLSFTSLCREPSNGETIVNAPSGTMPPEPSEAETIVGISNSNKFIFHGFWVEIEFISDSTRVKTHPTNLGVRAFTKNAVYKPIGLTRRCFVLVSRLKCTSLPRLEANRVGCWRNESELHHLDHAKLRTLLPTASEAEIIAYKRRLNTLAARKSRKRKLEDVQALSTLIDLFHHPLSVLVHFFTFIL